MAFLKALSWWRVGGDGKKRKRNKKPYLQTHWGSTYKFGGYTVPPKATYIWYTSIAKFKKREKEEANDHKWEHFNVKRLNSLCEFKIPFPRKNFDREKGSKELEPYGKEADEGGLSRVDGRRDLEETKLLCPGTSWCARCSPQAVHFQW